MEKTIKKLKLLSYICLAILLLNSCTQEKEFINENNHRDIDFNEKSFKEALSLPLFNDALKKVANQKGALRSEDAARTALEDQYGFTIVTDAPIRIITDENGTVFYTILIEREVKEELVFENLMIKVEDEETTAAIFKYFMTEKGTITDDGNYVFSGYSSSQFTDLNIEGKMFFNSGGETCFSTNVIRCNDTSAGEPAGHLAHSGCWAAFTNNPFGGSIYNSTEITCISGSGIGMTGGTGGGDAGGPSSNNTGGVGASGGTPDPVIVSPIPCRTGNCIEDMLDPCDKISSLFTNHPAMQTELASLANKTSETQEHGRYKLSTMSVIQTPPTSVSGEVSFPPPSATAKYIMMAHTHNSPSSSTYSIFSWHDLEAIANLVKTNNVDTNQFVAFLATADGTFYALTIDDVNAFIQFFALPKDPLYNFQIAMKRSKAMVDYYDPSFQSTVNPLINENGNSNLVNEKAFLNLLQNNNMGMTLFETDANFNSFTKVKINKTTNNIEPNPCP
jgi:hypothetical protein